MKAEIEHYARQDSLIHRWDARWKLASLIIIIFTMAAVRRTEVALASLIISAALLMLCRLPFSLVMRRMWTLHIFLVPCFIILPFTTSGNPVSIGPVSISMDGTVFALTLYFRALAIVLASIALLYSTSMSLLLRAAERLYAPRVLIQVTLLTYRYIFTLANELTTMRWALATRGFHSRMDWRTYRTLANMVGMTLVRSLERTDRIYRAMQCRGYNGSMKTLHQFATRPSDYLICAACLITAVLLLLADTCKIV
jgi:cobalt/nickel transport system permease protein